MTDQPDATAHADAPAVSDAPTSTDPTIGAPAVSDAPTSTDPAVGAPDDVAVAPAPEPVAPEVTTSPETLATFVVVEVTSVAFPLPSPSPTVFLREVDHPYRGIEFPVGLPEAQSIALALDREPSARPTPHELMAQVLAATRADVIAVRLIAEHEGTLHAELDVMTAQGREVLDCRPSDGIAIALRQAVPAPILCDVELLDR